MPYYPMYLHSHEKLEHFWNQTKNHRKIRHNLSEMISHYTEHCEVDSFQNYIQWVIKLTYLGLICNIPKYLEISPANIWFLNIHCSFLRCLQYLMEVCLAVKFFKLFHLFNILMGLYISFFISLKHQTNSEDRQTKVKNTCIDQR